LAGLVQRIISPEAKVVAIHGTRQAK
jgi:hypothetical protein